MRSAVAIVAMAALAIGTWAAPASAQDDGVYFDDPNSPGGKEYSIPHERERRDNRSQGGGGSDDDTPRFGAGIEPEDGGSAGGGSGSSGGDGSSGVAGESESGSAGGGGSESRDGSDGAGAAGGGSGEAAGSGSAEGGASYQATSSSSDPELSLSALALGVILVGGGFGLLLRRSRRGATG
jgi:hypothetical protein